MRIAYVEDNPTNLALVERVAGMNKHVIVSYTEGEVALLALKRERFDLILMDVELAGDMGGLEVVRNLRAYGLQTPIVAVTAYAMIGDRDKCMEAGCNDYLPKPLPIPQLISVLNHYDEITKQASSEPAVASIAPTAKIVPESVLASVPAAPEPVPAPTANKDGAVPTETPIAKPEPTSGPAVKDELKP
jgi:CheY-like chemotaxis protein